MPLVDNLIEQNILFPSGIDKRYRCICGSNLMYSSVNGHVRTVKHMDFMRNLASRQTDQVQPNDEQTIAKAISTNNLNLFRQLAEDRKKINNHMFTEAIKFQSYSIAHEIISMGFVENENDNLIRVCKSMSGDENIKHSIIQKLIAMGIDIEYNRQEALRWAIYTKNSSCIKLLVEAGGNVEKATRTEQFTYNILSFLTNNGYKAHFTNKILEQTYRQAVQDNKLQLQIIILRDLVVLQESECTICMTDRDAFYKCLECSNTICVDCRDHLPEKKCPFCRTKW